MHSIDVVIQMNEYEYFHAADHGVHDPSFREYAQRVVALPHASVKFAAGELGRLARAQHLSPLDETRLVLSFVQHLTYASDLETTGHLEYGRYPVETLVDRVGDCDCHAILAAALLRHLGFEVVLLLLPQVDPRNTDSAHIAIAIAGADHLPERLRYYRVGNRRYFYCETTGPGADFGELPPGWTDEGVTLLSLNG